MIRAGKLQLPAIQGWGAEQDPNDPNTTHNYTYATLYRFTDSGFVAAAIPDPVLNANDLSVLCRLKAR